MKIVVSSAANTTSPWTMWTKTMDGFNHPTAWCEYSSRPDNNHQKPLTITTIISIQPTIPDLRKRSIKTSHQKQAFHKATLAAQAPFKQKTSIPPTRTKAEIPHQWKSFIPTSRNSNSYILQTMPRASINWLVDGEKARAMIDYSVLIESADYLAERYE